MSDAIELLRKIVDEAFRYDDEASDLYVVPFDLIDAAQALLTKVKAEKSAEASRDWFEICEVNTSAATPVYSRLYATREGMQTAYDAMPPFQRTYCRLHTPRRWHAAMLREAIKRGSAVICEP